ncbi:NACHT domain-containing protein [Ktedonobacter robiniae]|uniref:AAA+ ATPase domain-containing protein n=1 Tax=Ktedonobacter robiniae TaxID=2778365 RepID=A0ABQ3URC7_9CHLR|nr:NACHT domain-containing protein [Ktedonobacter robiniae]GHO55298.1 hypothetical protein KSB_37730 [Ktedonobacter robiniae]
MLLLDEVLKVLGDAGDMTNLFPISLKIFFAENSIVSPSFGKFAYVISVFTKTPPSPTNAIDPVVIAAIIGFLGVVIGAVIAGIFAFFHLRYQIRRNAQIEKQRLEDQFIHEERMKRLEQTLEAEQERAKREQERQESAFEDAHIAMQRAKTLAERLEAYKKALCADPHVTRLQILDMTSPLEIRDIYIRLQLHQEIKLDYEVDPVLRDAESQHDPNILLKATQKYLEDRVDIALAPEEAIRKYKHCVIVGDPGAGKSTLLKYLALQSIDQQLVNLPNLPIHVELNAFVNSGYRNLIEFAATVWEDRYGFPKIEAVEYIHQQLREGKALLLLDALDETVTGATKEEAEEVYVQVSKAIIDISTRYHQAPIVVTVRKAGYHQRARLIGFTELEVLDFRPGEIKRFVEHWFANHSDPQKRNNASELNLKLEQNSRMQTLAANPLLLSLIVIVYEDRLDLPERRSLLYKQCVDTLLTKWDASRNIRRLRAFKPEHKRQLLEEVAWHFHLHGQRYFPERDLLDIITNFLPAIGLEPEQNGQVLDEILSENGLLKEQARGWYGFLHLTIQEYLAAQYAVDYLQLDALLMRCADP